MRRLITNEILDLLERLGLQADGPRLLPRDRRVFVMDFPVSSDSQEIASIARQIVETFPPIEGLLLWIQECGVWPTEEMPAAFDLMMKCMGDERPLIDAPGMVFDYDEQILATVLLRLCLISGWDAGLAHPASGWSFAFSHDQWFSIAHGDEHAVREWVKAKPNLVNPIQSLFSGEA